MSVYKRAGQSEYSYDFVYRRQRFSGSTGQTTRREAEKFLEREKERTKTLFKDANKPLTLATACAQHWNEVGQHLQNGKDNTRAYDWLMSQIGPDTLLCDISDAVVARAVAKRRGDMVKRVTRTLAPVQKPNAKQKKYVVQHYEVAVSPATVNRTVTVPLRTLLKRARKVWKQSVQDIEWKQHLLKEPQERTREASEAEEATLMAEVRGDYEPALRFAILSGCRRAEIVGLEWSSVDFFNQEFTVLGKGNKRRTIPMDDDIYELLWSLKNDHPTSVFSYVCRRPRQGQIKGDRYPLTMEGFKTQWRRTRGRAGIENYRFHDNRHTAATRLVRSTGNIKLAQQLLGHSEIATTSRYSHVTKDDLRAGLKASRLKKPKAPKTEKKDADGTS